MSQISAEMVKRLRQRTGAGVLDCRNALAETGGDEDKAVEVIQKKGLAKVVKKAGAIAAEGMVFSYVHPGNRLGVLVEVNCETDFAARNEEFKAFVEQVGMQIASMNPEFVSRQEIPEAALTVKRELFKAQVQEEEQKSGKKRPEQVVEKIVSGKLEKWIADACLLEQSSVMEEDKTIGQIADQLAAKIGEKVAVRRFVRFELGEGLEKKKSDLTGEVASALAEQS
jgi:elongation factor Ts